MERRVERLEAASDYQKRDADEANARAYELENRVERLERLVAKMAERLRELGVGENDAPGDARPPHW